MKWGALWDWNALLAISTTVLVIVAAWQIQAIRAQNKKERTLNAATRYDIDNTLDISARNLRTAHQCGTYKENPAKFRPDVVNILNYLDTIAIGIQQNLYIKKIARDHLKGIVKHYCQEYLNEREFKALGLDMGDYQHLIEMRDDWARPTTEFRDGPLSWLRKRR